MIYSITFELRSNSSNLQDPASRVIWAKSDREPTMDTVQKLLERLFGDDVDRKSIRVMKGGEEWDEREVQKGARLYDLDQE
jgi:hypothetical protein